MIFATFRCPSSRISFLCRLNTSSCDTEGKNCLKSSRMMFPSLSYRLKWYRKSFWSSRLENSSPFPGKLAPLFQIIPGRYSGHNTFCVNSLNTCLSYIFGASIGRVFPLSDKIKWQYFSGFHSLSRIRRLITAVPESKCRSKFCVLLFQRTPEQHFFPAAYRFPKVNTSSTLPT